MEDSFFPKPERGPLAPLFLSALPATIFLLSGVLLSQCAFSRDARKKIKERDRGVCVVCGRKDNLECAHISHDQNLPNYNDPSNGRLLCLEHHLEAHVQGEGTNGLSIANNRHAKSSLLKRVLALRSGD